MILEEKKYLAVAATIFLVIALLHLLRLMLGWYVEIGGWSVPFWLSWTALIISGYLAYKGFKFSKK